MCCPALAKIFCCCGGGAIVGSQTNLTVTAPVTVSDPKFILNATGVATETPPSQDRVPIEREPPTNTAVASPG